MKSDYLPNGVSSLCELYDRYHAAAKKIDQAKGVPGASRRIIEAMAPRFINGPDWSRAKKDGVRDPYYVYSPAPEVWSQWDKMARLLDEEANRGFQAGSVASLSVEGLLRVHRSTLNELIPKSGVFRSGMEVGRAVWKDRALPIEQADAINQFEIPLLAKSEPMMTWHPSQCLDDRSPQYRTKFATTPYFIPKEWPKDTAHSTFKDESGVTRQCGWIEYAPPEEIMAQLDKLLGEVNSTTRTWGSPESQGDPIFSAAHAQRWFVGIHPFPSGNGRMSRFIMDWILEAAGLPPAILPNMDDDVGTSEKDWARQVGRGILTTVEIVEHCAARPDEATCQIVPLKPTGPGLN